MATSLWALISPKPLEQFPVEFVPEYLRLDSDNLILQPEFHDVTTMQDQVGLACCFLRDPGREKRVSFGNIATFFQIGKGSVVNYRDRHQSQVRLPHRTRLLPAEAFYYIRETVSSYFEVKTPISYRMLVDRIQQHFGISLRPDTLRHICRTVPGVKSVTGINMERERVQCNQESVAAFSDGFEAICEDITAAFVWSMDESGCSAWGDKQDEYRVLVPDSYQGDWMHVPVDR
jgi:hypothetical protein